MNQGIKYRRIPVVAFIVTIVAACAACFLFLIRSSAESSQEAAMEISSLYLREMTEQTIGHFETDLDDRFSQLRTSVEALNPEDLKDQESLAAFLQRTQENNEFSFISLLDDKGNYHSTDGVFPAASKISFLGKLLKGECGLISYDETILGDDMILLGECISPLPYGDGDGMFIAVLAGLDTAAISTQLSLENEDARTYSGIVSENGNFIVYNNDNAVLPAGTNIISMLQKYAVFEPGYSLEDIQKDFQDAVPGIVSCTIDKQDMYLYYSPIPDNDWLMLTVIPYELVDGTVSNLTHKLNQNAIILLALVVAILSAVFFSYYTSMNHSTQALQRANEKAEKARRRAEDANLAKSEFLSRMSHEIRTPMNGIIGMGAIAMQNVNNPSKVADCLKKISLSSNHLLSLINDVLDMSKIESGKVELKHEKFDFRVFLEGLGNIYYSQSNSKGVDFETILRGEVDEALIGDSLRLNQILSNLLSNALKFTPCGGAIRLRISEVRRDTDTVWLRFEVSDTGCGIAEKNFDKIFESFEQENSDVTNKYGGTGLGLSIVKRFSELMGGGVSVTSVLGSGSTFTLELPFGLVKAETNVVQYQNVKALVVDDDMDTCEHVTALLTQMKVHADWVDNGYQAVSKVEVAHSLDEDYDVCFVDWKMPNIDGLETVRRMRSIVGDGISVVLITAYDIYEIEQEARAVGAVGVIPKPLFESTIAEALASIKLERPFYDVQTNGPADYDFRGKHILLAEDNELNREIATELIGATGASIDSAEDGVQVLDMFEASLPGYYDLILMDVQMPYLDGYEATRKIRGMSRSDAGIIPIIAMTANAFAEDERKSLESGMNAHISKPLDVKSLYAQMNMILTGKKNS